MGRELKRVPLDFDWPQGEGWEGYINPHYRKCPSTHCIDGSTPARKWLAAITSLIMIAGEEAAKNGVVTHPYLWALSNMPDMLPTPDMAELSTGLAGRSPEGRVGHDSMDHWEAERKIIAAAGLDPDVWGICPVCKGEDVDPAIKEAYEAWEKVEPPTGEGYQLWETTSEGSPSSPVFATLDELCAWCETNATTFASHTATALEWKSMLSEGMVYYQEGNAIFL